jgi:hypothetical protein
MKKKFALLSIYDPEDEYRAKTERIAAFHAEHNPDGVDSVRAASIRGGRSWCIMHLIDKEMERIDNMGAVDEF